MKKAIIFLLMGALYFQFCFAQPTKKDKLFLCKVYSYSSSEPIKGSLYQIDEFKIQLIPTSSIGLIKELEERIQIKDMDQIKVQSEKDMQILREKDKITTLKPSPSSLYSLITEVPVRDIEKIVFTRKGTEGKSTLIGALIGASTGAVLGAIIGSNSDNFFTPSTGTLIGAIKGPSKKTYYVNGVAYYIRNGELEQYLVHHNLKE